MEIIKVKTRQELKKFIDFQYDNYEGDENFVPEPFVMISDLLNKKKNMFFRHSKADLFMATDRGRVLGRIAAIRNNNHNQFHKDKAGFFGFFEVVEDYEVARQLLDTAVDWLKKEGLTSIIGPTNFSTNETCGFLVEGFEYPPTVMMPYNKRYYPEFLEKYGFVKRIGMFAYNFSEYKLPDEIMEFSYAIEKDLKEKGITVRTINFNTLEEDILMIRDVYNKANAENTLFVPLTVEEFTHAANDLKFITNNDPDYISVAEKDGKIIAFTITLPDINKAFKKMKRGRLFPFGIFKLLYYKKRPERLKILIVGILKEYQSMGIGAVLYAKIFENTKPKGLKTCECGYILEDNIAMNKVLQNQVKAKLQKKYTIYEYEFDK